MTWAEARHVSTAHLDEEKFQHRDKGRGLKKKKPSARSAPGSFPKCRAHLAHVLRNIVQGSADRRRVTKRPSHTHQAYAERVRKQSSGSHKVLACLAMQMPTRYPTQSRSRDGRKQRVNAITMQTSSKRNANAVDMPLASLRSVGSMPGSSQGGSIEQVLRPGTTTPQKNTLRFFLILLEPSLPPLLRPELGLGCACGW